MTCVCSVSHHSVWLTAVCGVVTRAPWSWHVWPGVGKTPISCKLNTLTEIDDVLKVFSNSKTVCVQARRKCNEVNQPFLSTSTHLILFTCTELTYSSHHCVTWIIFLLYVALLLCLKCFANNYAPTIVHTTMKPLNLTLLKRRWGAEIWREAFKDDENYVVDLQHVLSFLFHVNINLRFAQSCL